MERGDEITKMAAAPIYGKSSSSNQKSEDLETRHGTSMTVVSKHLSLLRY